MPSPYSVSVDPSPDRLRMFFGRRREIRELRNCLLAGDSVLLLGERRMGKTFLLYMVGEIGRRGADFYEQLLDRQTATLLAEFHKATASYCWPLVDMLSVASVPGFYLQVLAGLAQDQAERFATLWPIDHVVFLKELARLSENLAPTGRRAVVLVDECEKLLEMDGGGNALSCLKAAIQQCDAIDFLLAGDIKSHQVTAEFKNLEGTCRPVHVAPLDPDDVRALIQVPLKGQLSFEETALQRIIELTGGKPSLVQILCDHLYTRFWQEGADPIHVTSAELDRAWEAELRDKVFTSFDAPLRDFFGGLQGDERSIFCFLAHHPLATKDEIGKAMGIGSASVRRGLQTLQTSHRIENAGSGFRICGKIVEEYGSLFVDCPGGNITTLQDIIAQGESATLEFKSSLRWDCRQNVVNEDIEAAVLKTLAAFLNTGGGTLIIGVDDDGQVVGLARDYGTFRKKNRDGFELHLMGLISNNLGKSVCHCIHPTFDTINGLDVCKVEVEASGSAVYMGKVACFCIRTGNQTQQLNPKEAVEYVNQRWGKS